MAFFRQRRNDLDVRVARLLQEDRAARATLGQSALEKVRDDAWQLQRELVPLADSGNLRAARALLSVASVCVPHCHSSSNWAAVIASGHALNLATTRILHGDGLQPDRLRNLGYPDLPTAMVELASCLYGIPEAIAYAGHRADLPLAAIDIIETLTNVIFEMRMNASVLKRLDKRDVKGKLDWDKLEGYSERRRKIRESARPANSGTMTLDVLRVIRETQLPQLAALSATGDPFDQFVFSMGDEHAFHAATLSGRTLLYVLGGAGTKGGVAIRLTPGGQSGRLADTAYLPSFQGSSVRSRVNQIQAGFGQVMTRRLHIELARSVQSVLDWTGESAWRGMLDVWPDLFATPLLVVGVGSAGLLPLYTASVNGEPVCAQADMTMAPSARSVHFASVLPVAGTTGPVAVAADPWHGLNRLITVTEEAEIIAAVHGVTALLYGEATSANRDEPTEPFVGPPPAERTNAIQELKHLLGEASLVHLACHGTAAGPALLLDGSMILLNELVGGDIATTFSGRPVIVLSACEVGGYTSDLIPGEHFGFPAGLIALGARAVVGALWPVPDSQETISLMTDFHQRLLHKPSQAALPEAILAAQRRNTDPTAWASFMHFGL